MKAKWIPFLFLLAGSMLVSARDGSWLQKVSAKDRAQANPYAGNPQAAAAGRFLFEEYCARCHGTDALGRRGRPSLRGKVVEQATDGDLAWILRNGQVWKGMPSWSSLPLPERWQIITYLRSLPHELTTLGARHKNNALPEKSKL